MLVSSLEKRRISLFDDVKTAARAVVQNLSHVAIHHEAIAKYASLITPLDPNETLDETHHYVGNEEETASYILSLECLNFGSAYKDLLKAQGWELIDQSIYFTVSTRLKSYYESRGALTADDLIKLSAQDIRNILELPYDAKLSIDFSNLCAETLNDLGRLIFNKYSGSFYNFLQSSKGDVESFIREIITIKNFNDIHFYKGLNIPFYKRAQHVSSSLDIAFKRLGISIFDDMNALTAFADNDIPNMLRHEGLVGYGSALSSCIESGQEIKSGSEEEIELRACAIYIVEEIAALRNLKATDIDYYLWHRHLDLKKEIATKPHKTFTTFY